MNQQGSQGGLNWRARIGYHIVVRQREDAALDLGEVLKPPRSGASEEVIAAVEARWGGLEVTYREFLTYVDGWEGFKFDAALLGTAALLDERTEADVAHYLQMCEVEPQTLSAGEVMPLTTVSEQGDLTMVWRAGTPRAGQVIWWAPSGEVQRYPDFVSYLAGRSELVERGLADRGWPRVVPRATHDDLDNLDAVQTQVSIAAMLVADPAALWPMAAMVDALGGCKAALSERGHGAVWGGARARGGASGEQVRAVEQLYGVPLLAQHADLLYVVDGWEHVFVTIDLLSADQLQDPARMGPAVDHARAVLGANGHDANHYLVLACAVESEDTVVVHRGDGQVLWLHEAEEIVSAYPDVRRWLLRVIRAHLDALDTIPAVVDSPL